MTKRAKAKRKPLAEFEAWAARDHEITDQNDLFNDRASVVVWGDKPIRVKVTVEAI